MYFEVNDRFKPRRTTLKVTNATKKDYDNFNATLCAFSNLHGMESGISQEDYLNFLKTTNNFLIMFDNDIEIILLDKTSK